MHKKSSGKRGILGDGCWGSYYGKRTFNFTLNESHLVNNFHEICISFIMKAI